MVHVFKDDMAKLLVKQDQMPKKLGLPCRDCHIGKQCERTRS